MKTNRAGGKTGAETPVPVSQTLVLRQLAQGESHLEQARIEQAIACARGVLSQDPNHLGGLELLARAQWRGGEYEAGLDTLRHLIRLNPYEPGYQFLAGGVHQALGHYGEAVRAYTRCLSSENEQLRRSAATAIRELEAWQETLIAELLKSNRTFRSEYAAEPMEACRKMGFGFTSRSSEVAEALSSRGDSAVVWEIPS